MRQPTFLAQAWPRFDHQVYWSGLVFRVRNTSTQPNSSKIFVSQARSSGRKPEFFWFARQFFKSISLCAMFQSPQRMYSRPSRRSFCNTGRKWSRKRNFDACRCGPAEPDVNPVGLVTGVECDTGVALLLRAVEITVIAPGRAHLVREIAFLRLDLLHADDVGILAFEPAEQTLGGSGADAVDVECDDAHGTAR